MATRVVLVIGALALALGACGDDDDGGDVSEEEQPYVDALVESAAEDEATSSSSTRRRPSASRRGGSSILGVDRLEEAGDRRPRSFADDDLDFSDARPDARTDGEAMYDALGECDVDVRESSSPA